MESQFQMIQSDVTEIKADVKALVATQTALATALAVRTAEEKRHEADRGSTGVWARTFLPAIIAASAVLLTILHMLSEVSP